MSVARIRVDAFRASTSVSAALHERAINVMPGGNTRTTVHLDPYPPYIVKGSGTIVIDAEGQERTDFLNNYSSLIHGHADPDVVAAVQEQLVVGSSYGFPTPSEIELAELIIERVTSVGQIRFTNSGTEAVMMALHAARAYTGRPMIAKIEGAYHGSYDFAAVSTSAGPLDSETGRPVPVAHATGTPDAIVDNVVVLPFNDLEMMEQVLEEYHARLAAVLIDLMPWRMSLIAAEDSYVRRLRELTAAYGIVLIFDEVITLRVATGGMQSVVGVTPDLTTMGKVIGGGFPVGAVGGNHDVMSVFDPRGGHPRVPHGGTFTANPISMVGGLVTLKKLTPEVFAQLDEQGTYLRSRLTELLASLRIPGEVRGRGSLFAISLGASLERDFRDWLGSPADRNRRSLVYTELLHRGILVAPHLAGCLSTPMTTSDLDLFVETMEQSLCDLGV